MSLADQILALNNDLPIRTDAPVHSGKVRSALKESIRLSKGN